MKKKFNIMLCTLIGVLSACNEYDFDQEQYRNEVGLLSNSSLIYDRQVANVGQEKDTIYLVATVSGSQISPNTHHVALLESDSLLKASFDAKALGRFDKSIGIYSNATPNLVYLKFTGEVVQEIKDYSKLLPYAIGNIRIDRDEFSFPDVYRGQQPSMTFSIANPVSYTHLTLPTT